MSQGRGNCLFERVGALLSLCPTLGLGLSPHGPACGAVRTRALERREEELSSGRLPLPQRGLKRGCPSLELLERGWRVDGGRGGDPGVVEETRSGGRRRWRGTVAAASSARRGHLILPFVESPSSLMRPVMSVTDGEVLTLLLAVFFCPSESWGLPLVFKTQKSGCAAPSSNVESDVPQRFSSECIRCAGQRWQPLRPVVVAASAA